MPHLSPIVWSFLFVSISFLFVYTIFRLESCMPSIKF